MKFATGMVTINDEPTKKALFRFCEKKIDQWLRDHFGNGEMDPGAEFRVEFTEDDDSQQISCVTEISLRGALWRGYDLANDSQQAFMHSLKRLQLH